MNKIYTQISCILLSLLFFMSELYGQEIKNDYININSDSAYLNIVLTPAVTQSNTNRSGAAKVTSSNNSMSSSVQAPAVSYTTSLPVLNLSRSSLTSYAIGEIPIITNIAPNGSVTASVPLDILPSTGGMQPQVALTYNSQSGNGLAGYGWHLAGISSITRRAANYTQDNIVLPASSSNNYFSLDGQRMLLTESNGEIQTYSLEGSNLGAIAVFYNYANEPYWVIKYANGITAEYRSNINKTIWYVSSQTDRFGNTVEYRYGHFLCNSCGENYVDLVVSNIIYGRNYVQGTSVDRVITFEYEDRIDKSRTFYAGTNLAHSKRLKSIDTGIKSYSLTYENSYYSMLKRIDCTASLDGKTAALSPLDFSYGIGTENTTSNTGRTSADMMVEQTTMPFGYFTDGKWDNVLATTGLFSPYDKDEGVVSYPQKDFYRWGQIQGQNYRTMHSMYHKDDAIFFAPTFNDAANFGIRTYKAEEGFRGIVTMNADNIPETQEIVLINANGSYYGTQNIKFRIIGYAGLAEYGIKTVDFQLPTNTTNNGFASVNPISYTAADITGKGKEVIIGVQKYIDAGQFVCNDALYVFDIENSRYLSVPLPKTFESDDEIIIADYDGNGTADLFHLHGSGMTVYGFKENGNNNYELTVLASTNQFNRDKRQRTEYERFGFLGARRWDQMQKLLLGDINGDGILDLLTTPMIGWRNGKLEARYGNNYTQCLSTGASFEVSTYSVDGLIDIYRDVLLHDFNGDGKADIVNIEGGSMKVFYSDGDRISYGKKEIYYKPTGIDYEGKLFTIDSRSSNHNRVIGYIRNNQLAKLSIRNNETTNTFLSSVTDSKNILTKFTYARIDGKDNNVYTQGGSVATFPYQTYSGYYWVGHTQTKISSGLTPVISLLDLEYSYSNAVIHRQGLGFCGFEKVSVYDKITQSTAPTTYNPYNHGVVMKQEDNTSETNLEYYPTEYLANKEPKIRLKKQIAKDKLTGKVVTTENETYDTYGNITSSKIIYGDDVTEKKTITYQNYKGNDYTIIGLPVSIYTTTTRGASSITQNVDITYNPKNLPQTSVKKINGEEIERKEVEYDAFSNVIKEALIPYGQVALKTTISSKYSANGACLEWIENAMGQRTTYSGYINQYLPKSVKDFKQRETTTEYDALGKAIKISYPDGTTENTDIKWGGNGLYFITKTITGKPTVVAHYDAIGREIRKSNQRFDGQWQHVDKEYDERGRVLKASLPFKGNFSPKWIMYSYDNYNRPTSISEPSGKTTTWSYNGNSITDTNNGIASTKQYDATRQLISVTDPGGTINYTLRADGQTSTITAPGGITTSFTYDNYGRKTSITDPSAGTQTIARSYEGDQSVIATTDANAKTVTSRYNRFGLLLSTQRPEFKTDYTYNADGLLINETSDNGTGKTFGYDNLGRVNYERTSNGYGNSWFDKSYTYTQGTLSSKTYSATDQNTIATENYTYAYGYLTETKLNNQTTIWKLTAENGLGQPIEAETGPLKRIYGYTEYGLPNLRATTFGNYKVLQIQQYNFDPIKGNLISRIDSKRRLTETFGYDNLNRLSTINDKQIQYADNGNITVMPGTGTLEYVNPQKPYAVTNLQQEAGAETLKRQDNMYNSLQRPDYVFTEPMLARFTYNASGERTEMDITKKGPGYYLLPYYIYREYLEEYEIHDREKHILYLDGDAYSAPAVYVKDRNDNQWKIYYLCRDYLGSITHIINADGTLKEEYSYSAWGKMRNPDTQVEYSEDGISMTMFLGRGYCGHEHIPYIGMINMNARLYDPGVGRFLSPDPYVQMPDFTQNFNRYSYCLNNPLVYVDKSGELAWFIPVIIGAVIGAETGGWISSGTPAFWKWNSNDWKAAVVGGIIGAGVGAGLSAAIGPAGGITGMSTSVVGTTTTTSTLGWSITSNSLITANINIASNFLQGRGLDGAFKGGIMGLASGALGGGLNSFVQGSSFGNWFKANDIGFGQVVSNSLYGFGDRFSRAQERGYSGLKLWGTGLLGMLEGGLMGYYFGGATAFSEELSYMSQNILSSAATSVPGLGLSMASLVAPVGIAYGSVALGAKAASLISGTSTLAKALSITTLVVVGTGSATFGIVGYINLYKNMYKFYPTKLDVYQLFEILIGGKKP